MNAFWASFRYSFRLFLVKENHIEGMEKKYLMMILKELISYLGTYRFQSLCFENHTAVFLRKKMYFPLGNVTRNGIVAILSFIFSLIGQKGVSPLPL